MGQIAKHFIHVAVSDLQKRLLFAICCLMSVLLPEALVGEAAETSLEPGKPPLTETALSASSSIRNLMDDDEGNIFDIDLQTGAIRAFLGQMQIAVFDIALDPSGTLYATGDDAVLYRITIPGGRATRIGDLGIAGTLDSLEFRNDGVLFGAGGNDIYIVDKETAHATRVLSIAPFSSGGDLAFDAAGNFYVTTDEGSLLRIDKTLRTWTVVGDTEWHDLFGLIAAADGRIYALSFSGQILRLSLENGSATQVASIESNTRGVHGGTTDYQFPERVCSREIYRNDFEGKIGEEWSSRLMATTPVGGRRFLGEFGNETVRLRLKGLPMHAIASVSFDLYLIRSWDGENNLGFGPPDTWELTVTRGPTLARTTFSNNEDSVQGFPGGATSNWDSKKAGEGAFERNTLGYTYNYGLFGGGVRRNDSVYKLAYSFVHAQDDLELNFRAFGLEGLNNESWGIDNIIVSVSSFSPVSIRTHPQNQTASIGDDLQFSIVAESLEPISYQWMFNGKPLDNATNATLVLRNVQRSDAGQYLAVVDGCPGPVQSQSADLIVNVPPFVRIVTPGDGTVVFEGGDFVITADASDSDGQIALLALYTNDVRLISFPGPPFSTTLSNVQRGDYRITARVRDNLDAIGVSEPVLVTVLPMTNRPPSISPVTTQRIDEENTLSFAIVASDPDIPLQTLTYALSGQLPTGISLNPTTGLFTWTPSEAQGSSTNELTVRVTDNGTPSQSATANFTVIAIEVNLPPVLAPISDQFTDSATTLTFRASTTDPDIPANELSYSLEPEAPAGANIDPRTGLFTFAPAPQATGTNHVTVTVTDNGTPPLSDSKTFAIRIVAPVVQPPSGVPGDIAVVHPTQGDWGEILVVTDYLRDLGFHPQVFPQEEISVAELRSFKVVIWHDLGVLELVDATVNILSQLQEEAAMPIYFIGERLASSQAILSGDTRAKWADMTRLVAEAGRTLNEHVIFNPGRDAERNQISGYWALADGMALGMEIDASHADPEAEVLAISVIESLPLVLRFPSTDLAAIDATRRFVQNFPVQAHGDDASVYARRALFENALCYLLNGEACECVSASMGLSFDEQSASALEVNLGDVFPIDINIINSGRCLTRGAQLTLNLRDGFEIAGVESANDIPWRWDIRTRTASFAIGVLDQNNPPTRLRLLLSAQRPGVRELEFNTTGNNIGANQYPFPISVNGVFILMVQAQIGEWNLEVYGMPESRIAIETSSVLGGNAQWKLLMELRVNAAGERIALPIALDGEQQYLRAVTQ